jgi:hypothetical protein
VGLGLLECHLDISDEIRPRHQNLIELVFREHVQDAKVFRNDAAEHDRVEDEWVLIEGVSFFQVLVFLVRRVDDAYSAFAQVEELFAGVATLDNRISRQVDPSPVQSALLKRLAISKM